MATQPLNASPKTIPTALLALLVSVATLVTMEVLSWAVPRDFWEQVDSGDLKLKVELLMSLVLGACVGLVRRTVPRPSDSAPEPPAARPRAKINTEIQDKVARRVRKESSERIRRLIARLEFCKQRYREQGQNAKSILTNTRSRLFEAQERLDCTRQMLFCGLALAFASLMATLLFPPSEVSSPDALADRRHSIALLIAMTIPAFVFGIIAASRVQRRMKWVALRVGGLASLYVNGCAVMISLVYSRELLFGDPTRRGPVFDLPIGMFVILIRVVVLPVVCLVSAWLGCRVSRMLRGREAAESAGIA